MDVFLQKVHRRRLANSDQCPNSPEEYAMSTSCHKTYSNSAGMGDRLENTTIGILMVDSEFSLQGICLNR